MYKSIRIQNFRGIKDLEIKDLGRVNLIVGANNVGKTSVLEALRILHLEPDSNDIARFLQWRGVDSFSVSPKAVVSASFHNPDDFIPTFTIRGTIETGQVNEVGGSDVAFSVEEDPAVPAILKVKYDVGNSSRRASPYSIYLTYCSNATIRPHLEPIEVGIELDGGLSDELLRTGRRNPFGPAVALFATQHLSVDQIALRFTRIQDAMGTSHILSGLRAFDETIEELYLGFEQVSEDSNEAILRVRLKGRRQPVPIFLLGSASNRLISILVTLPLAERGIGMIDEIENGVYHRNLPRLIRSLDTLSQQTNTQLFLTTHSWECVTAATEHFELYPDDFRLHRLERRDDALVVVTARTEQVAGATAYGFDVR